jgi:outer membrane lipoprotein-sorting protein
MTHIKFDWKGYIVSYDDGAIICTDLDLAPKGEYTMGDTMIVGSTLIPSDIRIEIKEEIDRTITGIISFG